MGITLDQIIIIFGQLATWITVVIVLFTLREMEKQRKSSYKPELVIPRASINSYWKDHGTIVLPTFHIRELAEKSEKSKLDESDLDWKHQNNLRIFNVGFGTAIQIEIQWTFDYDKVIDELQDYFYHNSIPIILNIGTKNPLKLLKIEVNKSYGQFINIQTDLGSTQYDYVLPASANPEGLRVQIPFTLLELLALSVFRTIHISSNSDDGVFEIQDILPPIELQIQYKDIGLNYHKKTYNVDINLSYLKHGNVNTGDECSAHVIEVSEI